MKKEINFLSVVENEWREEYDREWGLGLVLSTPNDGMCWVGKLLKDKDGYFLIPTNAYRSIERLKPTNYTVANISVELTNHN